MAVLDPAQLHVIMIASFGWMDCAVLVESELDEVQLHLAMTRLRNDLVSAAHSIRIRSGEVLGVEDP